MSEKQQSNIMQLTQLVIAVGALGVGGSSWFKAPDTTAVETGHKLHAASMDQLQTAVIRQHHDLKNLRTFLDGYVKEQHEAALAQEEAPRRRGKPSSRRPRRRAAPKLPSMGNAPQAMQHQDLGDVLEMNEDDLEKMMREMDQAEQQMAEEAPPEFAYDELPELPDMPDGPP